jgi:hypothetical protein
MPLAFHIIRQHDVARAETAGRAVASDNIALTFDGNYELTAADGMPAPVTRKIIPVAFIKIDFSCSPGSEVMGISTSSKWVLPSGPAYIRVYFILSLSFFTDNLFRTTQDLRV